MSASPDFPSLPAHWTEEQHRLEGGTFVRTWSNRERLRNPRRVLVLVHGQGEQGDRYAHFPQHLDGVTDVIVALDLPGHGLSAGQRGDVAAWTRYHDAVDRAIDHARAVAGPEPALHLLGHSMGGLIVLGFLAAPRGRRASKAVISAPLLELGFPPPPIKLLAAQLVGRLLPGLPLANGIDANDLTHDATVNRHYRENPLNHSRITPRWFEAMRDEAARVRALEHLDTPSLWIVPLADRIVSAPAALQLAGRLSSRSDVQVEALPGFFHESFNETGKDRVFGRLARYLQE